MIEKYVSISHRFICKMITHLFLHIKFQDSYLARGETGKIKFAADISKCDKFSFASIFVELVFSKFGQVQNSASS